MIATVLTVLATIVCAIAIAYDTGRKHGRREVWLRIDELGRMLQEEVADGPVAGEIWRIER